MISRDVTFFEHESFYPQNSGQGENSPNSFWDNTSQDSTSDVSLWEYFWEINPTVQSPDLRHSQIMSPQNSTLDISPNVRESQQIISPQDLSLSSPQPGKFSIIPQNLPQDLSLSSPQIVDSIPPNQPEKPTLSHQICPKLLQLSSLILIKSVKTQFTFHSVPPCFLLCQTPKVYHVSSHTLEERSRNIMIA